MITMVQLPAAVPSTVDTDAVAPRSYLAEVRTRFVHNRAGMIAVSALVLLAVAAMVAPLLSPYDPLIGNATRRLLPIGSTGHPFGTDEQGRDMLTRLLYGGRLSLLTGMLPVIVSTVIGTVIGATAGYLSGPVGAILMRTMDMLYAFPAIMLAIWMDDGRPFFFGHRRETINGKQFKCWKFRSMRRDADEVQLQMRAANGLFEIKEHFAAVGLGLLPTYWLFWRQPLVPQQATARRALTWLLAFIVWWNFLVGHVLNNIKGLMP